MKLRKRLPDHLQGALAAFEVVLAEVEPAKASLAEVMPSTRLPGRPLPDALLAFEEHLMRAGEAMAAWRRPELEEVWRACDRGLDEARARADALRRDAPDLGGFEGLIWAVGELMSPLGVFETAAQRFRDLRV